MVNPDLNHRIHIRNVLFFGVEIMNCCVRVLSCQCHTLNFLFISLLCDISTRNVSLVRTTSFINMFFDCGYRAHKSTKERKKEVVVVVVERRLVQLV